VRAANDVHRSHSVCTSVRSPSFLSPITSAKQTRWAAALGHAEQPFLCCAGVVGLRWLLAQRLEVRAHGLFQKLITASSAIYLVTFTFAAMPGGPLALYGASACRPGARAPRREHRGTCEEHDRGRIAAWWGCRRAGSAAILGFPRD